MYCSSLSFETGTGITHGLHAVLVLERGVVALRIGFNIWLAITTRLVVQPNFLKIVYIEPEIKRLIPVERDKPSWRVAKRIVRLRLMPAPEQTQVCLRSLAILCL